MVKSQLLWTQSERFEVTFTPKVLVLRKGCAGEMHVSNTPKCTTKQATALSCVDLTRGKEHTIQIEMIVRTEKTRLHYNDVVCEKQIGEGSFGVVSKVKFEGKNVAVKKMKEIGASEASMEEFVTEVGMLDKLWCDQIGHFYGACFIQNHIMMVTEFAPCGSLMDCMKNRNEPSEAIKRKLMLRKALHTCTRTGSSTGTSSRTTSLSSRWTKCFQSTGS